MFTGLVEEIGEVVQIEDLGDSTRITIQAATVLEDAKHGDSISVNGCCLTVMAQTLGTFSADVMAESLARTNLGDARVGDPVNLERAALVSTRLGGHIVQGHVDGTGTLLERVPSANWETFRFSVPSELVRYLVEKGSITVSGTSLTVVDVVDGPEASFSVSLIPTTLTDTILGALQPGTPVNLEVDVLAKYVERLLTVAKGSNS
ncbi:MAG: riboflavin synthase [Actinomycetales bacterium]|nr:riboflavin synthase [Actinomycetales bacterium]